MRIALAVILAFAACKKSTPPDPTPDPGSAGSAVVTPPVTDDPVVFKRLLDNTLEYTYDMIPLLASFDGDCAAQIERMKKLEPLVQKIRDDSEHVAPDFSDRIKQYMRDHKTEVVAKIEGQLAAVKMTRPELEAKEADLKAKCTSNLAYAEEMNRIGVMKKK
jgi:hypothetical protein